MDAISHTLAQSGSSQSSPEKSDTTIVAIGEIKTRFENLPDTQHIIRAIAEDEQI